MTDLFWPGDERAGALFSPARFVAALSEVEQSWLDALVTCGLAPPEAAVPPAAWPELTSDADVRTVALAAEAGGNPVIPLVTLLRERLADRHPAAASWAHQGLTSQDVVDTGLMRCSQELLAQLRTEFVAQVGSLRRLADRHRHTLMAGRTLGQVAVPITFGLKAAGWLQSVLDAAEATREVRLGLRGQFGGAAGTMAATVELAARAGRPDPPRMAEAIVAAACARLELVSAPPWATSRAPLTRIGDVLVGANDAWGHLANDVITLSRSEIGELAEPGGDSRGSSSTMPHKRNPVLSVLIRRSALSAPLLGAQLHLAAADTGDERPAGAWHTEWAALRTLGRSTATAASQATELLAGLQVDTARMLATVDGAAADLLAERLKPGPVPSSPSPSGNSPESAEDILTRVWDDTLDEALGRSDPQLDPRGYLGTNELTIETTLARAEKFLLLEG